MNPTRRDVLRGLAALGLVAPTAALYPAAVAQAQGLHPIWFWDVFTPKRIPGLVFWGRADLARSLFQNSTLVTPAVADADPVGGWTDQSGMGNHAITVTSSFRPVLKLTILNGHNTIRGDGVDDVLGCNPAAGLASTLPAVTIMHAIRTASSVSAYHSLSSLGVNSGAPNQGDVRINSSKFAAFWNGASTFGGVTGTTTLQANTAYIVTCIFANNVLPVLRVNGTAEGATSGSAQAFGGSPWTFHVVGNGYADGGRSSTADHLHHLIWNRALSNAELTRAERWLGQQCAVLVA